MDYSGGQTGQHPVRGRAVRAAWRARGVTSYALHPGVVATGRVAVPAFAAGPRLVKLFMIDWRKPRKTTLYCATSDSGRQRVRPLLRQKRRVARTSPVAADVDLAQALWTASEGWTEG